MSYILYSSLESLSRSFIATENLAGFDLVDWPNNDNTRLVELGISPSSFPSMASLLPANTAMKEEWVCFPIFSVAEGLANVQQLIAERDKQAQELPPLPSTPEYDKFLYLLANEPSLPLEVGPHLLVLRSDPSSLADDQKRYGFWVKMTSNPAYFVTPEVIATIEGIAKACNVQLTPPKE